MRSWRSTWIPERSCGRCRRCRSTCGTTAAPRRFRRVACAGGERRSRGADLAPEGRGADAEAGRGRTARTRGGGIPYLRRTVRTPTGPDWDFSAPPALATTADGRDVIIAPQKQGLVWALNPDNGAVLWKQDVAREIAGGRGETLFGGAVDNQKVYFGLVSGGHLALDLKTGEEVWYTPITRPPGRENKRGVVGAVTLIPGVLLSGAGDGVVRAVSRRRDNCCGSSIPRRNSPPSTASRRAEDRSPRAGRSWPTVWCSSVRGTGIPGRRPGQRAAGVRADRSSRCLRRRDEEALERSMTTGETR